MGKRLAIICTHPIQYYAPVFQLLAKQVELKVFYTCGEQSSYKYDKGFDRTIEWDLPLLEGYDYLFLKNNAKSPGTHHFKGILNPDLIKEVSNFEPSGILIYGWAWQSHLKAIRFFKGKIPIYFRGDSTLLNKTGIIKKLLRKIFLKWVYTNVDTAFYVGTHNKAYYKAFGLTEKQLILVPHAIDNHRFGTAEIDQAKKIRANLKVEENELIILFAGKLIPVKNPLLLLKAFIELGLPHVHLLFVGNGEMEESLKSKVQSIESTESLPIDSHSKREESLELKISRKSEVGSPESTVRSRETGDSNQEAKIKSLKLGEVLKANKDASTPEEVGTSSLSMTNIHFMDFQNQTQMPAVYQSCDLFCLPSKSETWGLAVNEAMAAGKPILISDKVGCAEDLVTEETGLIFKSNDIDDLKQKLIALTSDKKQLDQMGKSAQLHIQNWSFEEQLKAILNQLNG